jgi:hypothetical protein
MKRQIFNITRAIFGIVFLLSIIGTLFGIEPFALAQGGFVIATAAGAVVAGDTLTTTGMRENSERLLLDDIDEEVTKMWASAAPLDQLLRKGLKDNRRSTDSIKNRHYGVASKPFSDVATAAVVASNQEQFNLGVGNVSLYGPSDTIFIPSVRGYAEGEGTSLLANGALQLHVISVDRGNNQIRVMPVSGDNAASAKKSLLKAAVQNIAEGADIVIGGRAHNELTVQTEPSVYVPQDDYNYCQYFGSQIELSKWSKKHAKEVKWDEADQLEMAMYDYRVRKEISYWFGSRNVLYPDGKETFYCGGISYFVKNNINWTGLLNGGKPVIKPQHIDEMVRQVFSGNSGSGQRWMFCGEHFWNAIKRTEDIQKNLSAKEVEYKFGLYFNKINTGDGELVVIKHPLFLQMGMSYDAVILDVNNIGERHFEVMGVKTYDKEKLAQSKADAKFISETSCPIIKHLDTHAIIRGPQYTSLI